MTFDDLLNGKATIREKLLYDADTTDTERRDFRNAFNALKDAIGTFFLLMYLNIREFHFVYLQIIFLMVVRMIMDVFIGILKHHLQQWLLLIPPVNIGRQIQVEFHFSANYSIRTFS